MSRTKMMLEVVENLRVLADSLAAVCDAAAGNEDKGKGIGANSAPVANDTGTPAVEQQATTSKPKPALDLVTFRAAVAGYSVPENRPKIKAILNSYGVKKLTELKPEQYADVLAEVERTCKME